MARCILRWLDKRVAVLDQLALWFKPEGNRYLSRLVMSSIERPWYCLSSLSSQGGNYSAKVDEGQALCACTYGSQRSSDRAVLARSPASYEGKTAVPLLLCVLCSLPNKRKSLSAQNPRLLLFLNFWLLFAAPAIHCLLT